MTGRLTAGQRRIVAEADDMTGRITGSEAQLAGLVRLGLAFRHARPPRAHFLTPAGHRARAEFLSAAPPPPAPATDTGGTVFAARTGSERNASAPGPARRREVHSAWQGLQELRRMTNADGATDRPCAWERRHLVQAAALALEAAGRPPASGAGPADHCPPGYRVTDTEQPEAVAVRVISGPGAAEEAVRAELTACAAVLERAGWQVSEHGERGGGRVLLASPRRV
ncbi:hypothetical protein QIS99_02930 [Streptomyces sp. B-S-A8]|uniref:Uncharacterized protein n=1 Tax=Streptomyces solicavernae TaxID=3043614 RepID=A0ABT6RL78_9ACTN|nr:hypothetical protein [Streptomyces sp. B-S-A8]MDI3385177.1 hypothetical protein [Streptomyces sp. B-S-A8]